MVVTQRGFAPQAAAAAGGALLLSLATALDACAANDKTYVMKIALATLDDALHQYAKNYAAAVERDSGGRIKAEIYPASQLGSIERQAQGVQFGAIQCQIVAPEFLAGIDERFEVLAAPGLVKSMADGQRVAADPRVMKLMLGLGADKGLHGAGLFMNSQSAVIARTPIRHLADFKGKKIRIFASQFQSVAMQRLGATPKPMTLGGVLPALQDNALDGAVSSIAVFNAMHYQHAAKYVTETGQPAIFGIAEVSKKWYDSLPADLQPAGRRGVGDAQDTGERRRRRIENEAATELGISSGHGGGTKHAVGRNFRYRAVDDHLTSPPDSRTGAVIGRSCLLTRKPSS